MVCTAVWLLFMTLPQGASVVAPQCPPFAPSGPWRIAPPAAEVTTHTHRAAGSIAKFEQGSAAAVQSRLQGEVGYAGMPNRSVMKSD